MLKMSSTCFNARMAWTRRIILDCRTLSKIPCNVLKYQNTYRMEPQNTFKTDLVDKIVRSVMNNRLDEITYDDAEATKLCGDIATEIRRRVKKLNFDRHKIIVTVTIIEKASQSVERTLGFLWDSERDKYSAFSFEGRTFHAQCSVLGVYYE